MDDLKLWLLGQPRIELDGEPIKLQRRKALALLVYLAVTGEGAAATWHQAAQEPGSHGEQLGDVPFLRYFAQPPTHLMGQEYGQIGRLEAGDPLR